MKKTTIVFLTVGITLLILSLFYTNIAELCNCNRASIGSESAILRIWGTMLILLGAIMQIFKKYMSENLKPITAIISLMISATVSMGVYSFMLQWTIGALSGGKRPVANPASAVALIVSVVLFIVLILSYFIVRKIKAINTETLIDIVIFLAYLVPFFFTYSAIHSIISEWLRV